MQIINFFRRGFCFFDVRTAKKNIDALISKRQKPLETRLAKNLSRRSAYLLLTYIQYLCPCPNFVDSEVTAFLTKMESPISKPPKRGCHLSPVGWFPLM